MTVSAVTKGISPILSAVLLFAVTVSVVGIFANFAPNLLQTTSSTTTEQAKNQVRCESAGLDIVSASDITGYYGRDRLVVSLRNTGNQRLSNVIVSVFSTDGVIVNATENITVYEDNITSVGFKDYPMDNPQPDIAKAFSQQCGSIEVGAQVQEESEPTADITQMTPDTSITGIGGNGLAFSADGKKIFHVGNQNTIKVTTLDEPFELSSRVSTVDTGVFVSGSEIMFSPDGAKLFTLDDGQGGSFGGGNVTAYRLGERFNVNTIQQETGTVDTEDTVSKGLEFSSDGMKMFVSHKIGGYGATGKVVSYRLDAPYDLSSAEKVGSISFPEPGQGVNAIEFSPSGNRMYLAMPQQNKMLSYQLSQEFKIDNGVTKIGELSTIRDNGLEFAPSGTKLFVSNGDGSELKSYATG